MLSLINAELLLIIVLGLIFHITGRLIGGETHLISPNIPNNQYQKHIQAIENRTCDVNKVYSDDYQASSTITLYNCFVKVRFQVSSNAIEYIAADFHGNNHFMRNILAEPIQLSVYSSNNIKSIDHSPKECEVKYDIQTSTTSDTSSTINLHVESLCKFYSQSWNIELSSLSREIKVNADGMMLRDSLVNHVSYPIYTFSPFIAAMFTSKDESAVVGGILQMMNQERACLGTTSSDQLHRAIILGNDAALEIMDKSLHHDHYHVFHSYDNNQTDIRAGVEFVVGGYNNYPNLSKNMSSAWKSSCWQDADSYQMDSGTRWSLNIILLPNNYNFPVYPVHNVDPTAENLPFVDLQAYLTGIYASPVGCLQSYYDHQQGIIAPTIAYPDIGYSPDSNFFDPDNFLSLSAMLYAGDDYLTLQVRHVLERTAQTMCGIGDDQDASYCDIPRQRIHHQPYVSQRHHRLYADEPSILLSRYGQLMHHFISLEPTYLSIAGSEQLGPNIFWTLTVARYLSLTQDHDFAAVIFPFIDISTHFILSFIDDDQHLVVAPGPLWIDVLVRENYTSDSNSMMVETLRQLADLYDLCSDDNTMVMELRALADTITTAVNTYLWANTSDHLITQLNMDMATTRDFVDYDANLIAIAYDVISDNNISAVLNRVDNGPYTHIRATWCSEIPYSGNASDCYIVGGSVCGDSVVTLARIGYVDALARKRVHDIDTIHDILLAPLQRDLIRDTWLYERYNNTGQQIRTPYYFEYPSLVVMLLREVVYGIDIGLSTVTLSPLLKDMVDPHFVYDFGNTRIAYDRQQVEISLPGHVNTSRVKTCQIDSLFPSSSYTIDRVCGFKDDDEGEGSMVDSDAAGTILFKARFISGCTIYITYMA